MTYPVYNFNPNVEPPLDYDLVLVTVNEMFMDLLSKSSCCCSKSVMNVLKEANVFMRGISLADDVSDVTRRNAWIQAAYKILYPLASE